MKLHLVIEYKLTDDSVVTNAEDIEKLHETIFEEDPLTFINTIWHTKNLNYVYAFECNHNSVGLPDNVVSFDCSRYFYSEGRGSICLKYGALCSNSMCKDIK